MTFREMTPGDIDQVFELEGDLFSVPWTKEGFLTYLLKNNTLMFVIEEKGRILAYATMQTVLDEGDVLNVAVRRERQKEGIGRFLMECMIRMAAERGVTTVHLEVRESNSSARRLYKRLGFKEDGLRKNYYEAPVENAILMTRS